jgi:hypothetical protein
MMQANLQRTQAAAAAAASSAEKAVTSAATSTLRRLQQRLVESGRQLAEAMSDWGLIPRLGVIPLEEFEEVYPVREPGRLRPLYIQKASLPDILGGWGLGVAFGGAGGRVVLRWGSGQRGDKGFVPPPA